MNPTFLMANGRLVAAVLLAAGVGWVFGKFFESEKVGAITGVVTLLLALAFVLITPELDGV